MNERVFTPDNGYKSSPEVQAEPKNAHRKSIAFDFDGVIHGYSKGWQDGSCYDPPVYGALEFLRECMAKYAVFILTTRDVDQVETYLNKHAPDLCTISEAWFSEGVFWNKPGFVLITNRKLAAEIYIDDRAVRFQGNWNRMRMALLERPWNEKGNMAILHVPPEYREAAEMAGFPVPSEAKVPVLCDYDACGGEVVAGSYVPTEPSYTHNCKSCGKHFPTIEEPKPKAPIKLQCRELPLNSRISSALFHRVHEDIMSASMLKWDSMAKNANIGLETCGDASAIAFNLCHFIGDEIEHSNEQAILREGPKPYVWFFAWVGLLCPIFAFLKWIFA